MLTNKKSLFTFLVVLLFGCQQNLSSEQQPESNIKQENKLIIKEEKTVRLSFKGTVQHIGLEGGFFGIVTDKGAKILPMNLDKLYQQDGTIVEFSGEYKNVMTIQQWGKPFTITDIKLIKAGKNKTTHQKM